MRREPRRAIARYSLAADRRRLLGWTRALGLSPSGHSPLRGPFRGPSLTGSRGWMCNTRAMSEGRGKSGLWSRSGNLSEERLSLVHRYLIAATEPEEPVAG